MQTEISITFLSNYFKNTEIKKIPVTIVGKSETITPKSLDLVNPPAVLYSRTAIFSKRTISGFQTHSKKITL